MTDPILESKKPKVNSAGQRELDKAAEQLEKFDQNVKDLTSERSLSPKTESAPPEISQKELAKKNEIYLKPKRSLNPAPNAKTGEHIKFNEKFRDEYNFKKEYVCFVFENREIIGETTTIWTKPYPGVPAEEWEVPTNRAVWGPRYLAEQIKRKFYHRLKMEDRPTDAGQGMQFYGALAVDTTVQRLDAHPVNSGRKSIFMGASGF